MKLETLGAERSMITDELYTKTSQSEQFKVEMDAQLEGKASEIIQLESDLMNLQTQYRELETEKERLVTELDQSKVTIKAEVESFNQKIQVKIDEQQRLRDENEGLALLQTELEALLVERDEHVVQQEQANVSLNLLVESLRLEIQSLHVTVEQSTPVMHQLGLELVTLQQEKARVQRMCDKVAKQSVITAMVVELELAQQMATQTQLTEQWEIERCQSNLIIIERNQLIVERDQIVTELSDAKAQCKQLTEGLSTLETEKQALVGELDILAKEFDGLNVGLGAESNDLKDQLELLEAEKENVVTERNTHSFECERLRILVATVKGEMQGLLTDRQESAVALEKCNANCEQLKSELDDCHSNCKKLRSELEALKPALSDHIENLVSSAVKDSTTTLVAADDDILFRSYDTEQAKETSPRTRVTRTRRTTKSGDSSPPSPPAPGDTDTLAQHDKSRRVRVSRTALPPRRTSSAIPEFSRTASESGTTLSSTLISTEVTQTNTTEVDTITTTNSTVIGASHEDVATESFPVHLLERIRTLFNKLDADLSGVIEVNEINFVRNLDRDAMLAYLDLDGDGTISLEEWISWHQYVFFNLPARYATYIDFVEMLEKLSTTVLAASSVTVARGMWSRSKRVARAPRVRTSRKKETSEVLMNYVGHSDWVLAVSIIHDVNGVDLLVTASQDKVAKVFNVDTAEQVAEFTGHAGSVVTVSPSSDGRSVFSGSLDGLVCHWELLTGTLLHTYDLQTKGVLTIQATATDFFTGSRDNSAGRWSIETGKLLTRYEGHGKWVQCLSVQQHKLFTGSADNTLKSWDTLSGECVITFEGHLQEVTSLVVSGTHLYSGSRQATVKCWDQTTGECLRTYLGHLSVVRAVGLYQGDLFTGSADGTVRCWDTETGDCKYTVTGHEFAITSLALSKDCIYTGTSDAMIKKFAMGEPGTPRSPSADFGGPMKEANTTLKLDAADPFDAAFEDQFAPKDPLDAAFEEQFGHIDVVPTKDPLDAAFEEQFKNDTAIAASTSPTSTNRVQRVARVQRTKKFVKETTTTGGDVDDDILFGNIE